MFLYVRVPHWWQPDMRIGTKSIKFIQFGEQVPFLQIAYELKFLLSSQKLQNEIIY